MIAAVWNRLDIAEVLLESGASLDAEGVGGSYRGKTPIEIARERDRPAMAELLCAHRARRRLAGAAWVFNSRAGTRSSPYFATPEF